ncbi:DUF2125 domain-containing protein [Amylibacter sp.]|nr:DUF2125 domain-containing protein [Amylibacter sp.]MDB9919808.1 DUF2125 domain-containing protein [Amylibacter sp.]MDC1445282.1 DUF2125 domain-containing protein [Amylibacter sp.]
MRLLVIIILTAALSWSAYWFLGKSVRETALNKWFTEKSENGWIVENSLSLRGFPNRFDAIIKDIKLENPKSGLKWFADRLEILQLSYKPNHFIILGPLDQKIKIYNQELLIKSERLRSSLVFEPGGQLEINRSTISSENFLINNSKSLSISAENLIFALRKNSVTETEYDFGINLKQITTGIINLKEYDPKGTMPEKFDTLKLNVATKFNNPINQENFQRELKSISNLKINDMQFQWGSFKLKAVGDLRLDVNKFLDGKITLKAKNWNQLLDLALNNGQINQNVKNTIVTIFSIFSAISGNNQELEIPLKFSNKKMYIGIIPIANTPKIHF